MEPITVIRGTNNKPATSGVLADYFQKHGSFSGYFFVGYPIIGTPEGKYPVDALWLSPRYGVIIFDLIEGKSVGDFKSRQDEAANKVESKLKAHNELMKGRVLVVPIHTVSFSPAISTQAFSKDEIYNLCNSTSLEITISQFANWAEGDDFYQKTLSALQNISTIRKSRSKRAPIKEGSRGSKLKLLEDSIATLDNVQGKAVIETVEGVQRIRGLAGSGKTIVLALKAAYLHAQHPDWRIAVTFNTRSLKEQFRRLINTFSIEQTGLEPDWDNLRVIPAWGAAGGSERGGVYYEFCIANDLEYHDFSTARRIFGSGKEFNSVCSDAISKAKSPCKLYDAILIDEAQDFSPSFLRLCYMCLDSKRRLVYAYDELQNLSGNSMLSPEEIFGKGEKGVIGFTDFQQQSGRDIVLKKCYRNSRPVLVTAHALGFGIYRKPTQDYTTGLVQMFDHPELWSEIGYTVVRGKLSEGKEVSIIRTNDSSPSFLEEHSPIDDLIRFKRFDDKREQMGWLVDEIIKNITEDELRHEDIIVINPDPLRTRSEFGPIRSLLLEKGVKSHLAGVDTDPDDFFMANSSITFTGIYRAKGNEAGMVYIINGQDCHSSARNLATIRNRLFTAITRSKAWVRVLGIGEGMAKLIQEFEILKEKNFELSFKYPTVLERQQLAIIHRDMSDAEKENITSKEKALSQLLGDLKLKRIRIEDLNPDLLEELHKLLRRRI